MKALLDALWRHEDQCVSIKQQRRIGGKVRQLDFCLSSAMKLKRRMNEQYTTTPFGYSGPKKNLKFQLLPPLAKQDLLEQSLLLSDIEMDQMDEVDISHVQFICIESDSDDNPFNLLRSDN